MPDQKPPRSRWARLRRGVRKLVFYTCLLSMPVTLLPFLTGAISGVLFTYQRNALVPENTAAYIRELESDASMSYFNVPGAPSIFDVNTGPFYDATKLRTANWYSKMGLRKDPSLVENDAPIDGHASLDGLWWSRPYIPGRGFGARQRTPTDKQGARLMSKWVYVTWFPSPNWKPFDAAFVELLQHHAARPLPNGAEFYYVDCLASEFLCNIWAVKAPSLVHFTVDEDALSAPGGMYAVTVKVVELPLEDWTPAPGAFPYPFDQLHAITSGAYDMEIVDDYFVLTQYFRRFDDYLDTLTRQYRNTLGRLFKLKDRLPRYVSWSEESQSWVETVAGAVDDMTFLFAVIVSNISVFLYDRVRGLASWFVGTPGSAGTPDPFGEALTDGPDGDDEDYEGYLPGENMMADSLLGFFGKHFDMIGRGMQEVPEEVEEQIGDTIQDPKMRDTMKGLFKAAKDAAKDAREQEEAAKELAASAATMPVTAM
ncbi:hypothetical protein GQ53DRAFT_750141 [Thozetella sp. PMI_491]|nr:hypothetical protein GQ53DRAFT_750141 [Thozetella sp. PMI_491]